MSEETTLLDQITTTSRGFRFAEFDDDYGCKCSIQESSSALEPKLWLGMERDEDGNKVGVMLGEITKQTGARMLLTREQVRDLIPLLTYFVASGRLPPPLNKTEEADS